MSQSAPNISFRAAAAPERLVRKSTSLAELFLRRVRETPDREAFRYPIIAANVGAPEEWRSMTWRQTGERVRAIAGGLLGLGLSREHRVGLLCGTRVEWILADLGVLCAGGATTTVYPSTTAEESAYILSDSDSQFCFVEDSGQLAKLRSHKAQLPKLRHVILIDGAADAADGDWVVTLDELEKRGKAWIAENPRGIDDVVSGIKPEELATLVYTSGTTGRPKGVRLVHECWAYTADAIDAIGLWQADDVQFLWLPMSHVFGLVLLAGHVASGSVTAIDGRIPKIIDNLAIIKPTIMAAVPRIFEKVYNKVIQSTKEKGAMTQKIFDWAISVGKEGSAIKQRGQTPSGLLAVKLKIADKLVFSKLKERFGGRVRFFISGSAPLARDIAEFFHASDILILEGYGLTESSAASMVNRPTKYSFGSVGIVMPGTEMKLAPEDNEILLKSPGIMRGYHNLPDQTAEALTSDGWLRTGDIGEVDERGFTRITDRKKDLIKTSGGKYVAPQSIEGKLKSVCPYISQVVVHGDTRNFCSALITLDEESMRKWATDNNLAGKSIAELSANADVIKLVQGYIDDVNKQLAKWETIKKFTILPRDLTIEADELTPSLKVKRKAVEKKYMALLDKMYSGTVADRD